ncbi:MAG: ABC transporter permease [Prevotella sp.]|jgi:hypothetical protein|nr:ABC transporter permease [Prevotella sp.]MCR5151773.1 ABC transporter permease [Prevotella sp.]
MADNWVENKNANYEQRKAEWEKKKKLKPKHPVPPSDKRT